MTSESCENRSGLLGRGPWLNPALPSHLEAWWWVFFSNEARGRSLWKTSRTPGHRLKKKERESETEPGLGPKCHESPCREISKGPRPTPGQGRGAAWFQVLVGYWAKRQISVRLSVGIMSRGPKRWEHRRIYITVPRHTQANHAASRSKEERVPRGYQEGKGRCRPGRFGGFGNFSRAEDDAFWDRRKFGLWQDNSLDGVK